MRVINRLHVSVLIPTYKRAHLLSYALEGLKNQTYKSFEVIVVLKPSEDGTEEIVKKYNRTLDIKLVLQEEGYVTDALNLGIECAQGDIIAILDDDSVPFPNWIVNHLETYENTNIGGVTGDIVPATLKKGILIPLNGASEIVPNYKPFLESIGLKVWSRPIEGLEDYLIYISKAGMVEINTKIVAWSRTSKSLLGRGANMSVLAEAVKGFRFPSSWILGLTNEQFLGWHIWRKGYDTVFNPKAKVHHIAHKQALSRNIVNTKKQILKEVESQLLFYRLYDLEQNISFLHRIAWLAFYTLANLKHMSEDAENINKLKGTFIGNFIGSKWFLSKKFCLNYDIMRDLKTITGREY